VRNIQIDLKYKFLLVTDVAWLVIDIFAFTLLGGMVDGATDVTYAMDVNADIDWINEDLHIYIYDVEKDYFEFTETADGPRVRLMTHVSGKKFEPMERVGNNPNITLTIDGRKVLERDSVSDEFKENISFDGKWLTFDLKNGVGLLDPTVSEHRVEIDYSQGRSTTNIDKGRYFAFDTFEYAVAGSNITRSALNIDVRIERLLGDEGMEIRITDGLGGRIADASVFIDGEIVGETNDEGALLWETDGDPVVHYRAKGTHEVWVKYSDNGTSEMVTTSFLMASQKNRLGIDYNLKHFLLVGVIFWAFFGKSYEDTVNTIPEEASRGTIGFLVTNNVNISTLLISRNIASTVKTFVITIFCVILPMALLPFTRDVFEGFDIKLLPLLFLVFMLMWLFMLVVSILISSLNIIFKKITPAAAMIMYALKVLTGYYFPLEALDEYQPGLSDQIKFIPIVRGAYFIRDVIIIGRDPAESMSALKEMFMYTMLLALFTFIFYKILEHKSQRWGTLEFY